MLNIAGEELLSLIPQKHPFVFVSKLLSVEGSRCSCAFTVPDKHPLVDRELSAAGLIECMAQTCAVKAGYESRQSGGNSESVGYIAEVKKFKYSVLPSVGQQVFIEININNEVMNVLLVDCRVKLEAETIASCEMKIFRRA